LTDKGKERGRRPRRGGSAGRDTARPEANGNARPVPKKTTGTSRPAETGFLELQRGLTGERSLVGKSYMDDPGMLAAYQGYYWPASRSQCLAALDRLAFLIGARGIPEGAPAVRRLIDVGSGPGPVAAAFASRGATKLCLVDQSAPALALARRMIALDSPGADIDTVDADIREARPDEIPLWGSADCVSFGHSLNELWAGKPDRVARRAELLEKYAAALAPGGYVLAIEPALLETSRDMIAVRNLLVGRGWSVLAPCPGREGLACPVIEAGPSHTCHETARWKMPEETARLARSLGLDRERLKMTWFALRPPVAGGPEGYRFPPEEPEVFRVVSDPMRNKGGRLRRLLCGARGRFPLSAPSAGAGDATAFPEFDRLERGDFISVSDPEARENGWGMGSASSIARLFPRIY